MDRAHLLTYTSSKSSNISPIKTLLVPLCGSNRRDTACRGKGGEAPPVWVAIVASVGGGGRADHDVRGEEDGEGAGSQESDAAYRMYTP